MIPRKQFITPCVAALFALAAAAHAESVFVTNPDLPYPPGCAGDPGRTRVAFGETLSLPVPDRLGGPDVNLRLDAFRATCSEAGRSAIWLRFSAPDDELRDFVVEVPTATALLPHRTGPLMALVTSPGGWGAESDPQLTRRYLVHATETDDGTYYGTYTDTRHWDFLLDNAPDMPRHPLDVMTAAEYNAAFTLSLAYPGEMPVAELAVPATGELFEPETGIPISGRLEGLWVVEGARDQGVMISVSNRVGTQDSWGGPRELQRETQPLVLFVAHYTYGADGELLWLTGATEVAQGDNAASLALEYVSGGRFMADDATERAVVGSVRLVANGCNDLAWEYDYRALGLGEGSVRLQRLVSLETAGYDCRDYAARHEANR